MSTQKCVIIIIPHKRKQGEADTPLLLFCLKGERVKEFREEDVERDEGGKFSKKNTLTNKTASDKISGGITGATIIPESKAGENKAKILYEKIKASEDDVVSITETLISSASDLGITIDEVQKIKDYLFYDSHHLSDGFRPFNPDPDIADSWLRLTKGPRHLKSHDVTLIKHEIFEMRLVNEGMTQDDAHILATKKYNYQEECKKYHGDSKKRKERGTIG